ncbi:MAG: type II toxin-antitoxin system prevent-host-death family antitoxin [Chloroflexi bacterium]|nr:type II toxin-antitoxin system prevent-host-death family antitoxin [Chloroflexota bacterium]
MRASDSIVNIHDAKTHLSRLLGRVEQGEEIVIGRAGKPIARLVRYEPRREPRQFGQWAGKAVIGAGFDEADDEIARLFGAP